MHGEFVLMPPWASEIIRDNVLSIDMTSAVDVRHLVDQQSMRRELRWFRSTPRPALRFPCWSRSMASV